jgi:NDP-sugar pyrophosphorylase family protein
VTSALPPALILAAGLGTRLRPLSFCRAKAAVPVAGIPLICRHLTGLAAQGLRDVVVNLHHRPETIARVVGDGAALGCRVRYSWERSLLGSAGGPRRALPLLGDHFLIVNGDTLCDIDLTALVDAHRRSGALVTLAVTSNPAPHRYGGVIVDNDGWVTAFARPGDPRRPWHFVGIQVADAAAFAPLTDGVFAASIGGLYDTLLTGQGQVAIHQVTGRFHDIGTPTDYFETNRVMGADGERDVSRGIHTVVHPSAQVERSILWDDVSVGPGCIVTDSVLADGVRLPDDTILDRQAVVRVPSEPDTGFALPSGAARIGDLLTVPL